MIGHQNDTLCAMFARLYLFLSTIVICGICVKIYASMAIIIHSNERFQKNVIANIYLEYSTIGISSSKWTTTTLRFVALTEIVIIG